MISLFISYRRSDSAEETARIFDWLQIRFPGEVFLDVESITGGVDFARDIQVKLTNAQAMLLVIGKHWLNDITGRRQLDDPQDWVRREIELALEQNIPIIPLLVGNCTFPEHTALPDTIASIATRNCISVGVAPSAFAVSMGNLARALTTLVPPLRAITDSILGTFIDLFAERSRYLEAVRKQYEILTLPIAEDFALDSSTIYQPLQLKSNPTIVEKHVFGNAHYPDITDRNASPSFHQSREREVEPARQLKDSITVQDGTQALQHSTTRRLIVLGGPGTGKSTLLKRLAYLAAQRAMDDYSAPLPVYLSLPSLARSNRYYHLDEFLANNIDEPILSSVFFEELAKSIVQGETFLCMDGLDEVKPDLRPGVIDWIKTLPMPVDDRAAAIIGSRFTDYKGREFTRENYFEWELLPFTASDRQRLSQTLLHALHSYHFGEQHRILQPSYLFVQALEEHPQAADWGGNPFLFTLAANVFVTHGILPATRAALYREVVDAVIRSREPNEDRCEETKRRCAELALRLYQSYGSDFSRQAIRELLPEVCTALSEHWDPVEMIGRIVNSGLLEPVAKATYRFRHQTFQEYLVGWALSYWLTKPDKSKSTSIWTLIRTKRTVSRWTEPLRLMVGILTYERAFEGRQVAQQWLRELASLHVSNDDPGCCV